MTAVTSFIDRIHTSFGTSDTVQLMIPMDRTLNTEGDVRERLYANIIGHINASFPDDPFADLLDDLLMILAESDLITIQEATNVLNAIHRNMPDYYGRYEETLLDNAPSDEFVDAVSAFEPTL